MRAVSSGKLPAPRSCKLAHVDTRSLIALGMILAVVVVAVLRGVMDGAATKELLVILGSGIVGSLVPRAVARIRADVVPPAPDMPAGSSGPNRISAP